MITESENQKNMIKKYDKIFSLFQNMIKINMMKNIKFFTCMIRKSMIEKYDIKYDKDFQDFLNMIKKNMIKNSEGQKYDKTNMIRLSKNCKI